MGRVYLGFFACALGFPLLMILSGNVFAAVAVATVTGGISFFVGAPLFIWCRRRRWLAFWQCLIAGALAGLPVALPFAGFVFSYGLGLGELRLLLPLVGYLASVGAFHGALFWLVAIAGNDELMGPASANNKPRDYALNNFPRARGR